MSTESNRDQSKSEDQKIAARAYERWLRRGRPAGDGTEDWFAACAELEEERSRKVHDEDIAIYD